MSPTARWVVAVFTYASLAGMGVLVGIPAVCSPDHVKETQYCNNLAR